MARGLMRINRKQKCSNFLFAVVTRSALLSRAGVPPGEAAIHPIIAPSSCVSTPHGSRQQHHNNLDRQNTEERKGEIKNKRRELKKK
jgi:hypothetical protein